MGRGGQWKEGAGIWLGGNGRGQWEDPLGQWEEACQWDEGSSVRRVQAVG